MTDLKKRPRYRLILGKLPVVKVEPCLTGFIARVMMTPETYLDITVPIGSDIKEGDLLTMFTEVLIAEKTDAQTIKPSIQ